MTASERFAGQVAGMPEQFLSVFMPQLEQLGARPAPTRYGVLGRVERDEIDGWFWGCAPAQDIAITVARMSVREDCTLRGRPEVRYSTIGLMCRAGARMMEQIWMQERKGAGGVPGALPAAARGEGGREEARAFWVNPREYEFPMAGGMAYGSAGVHFLPGFFDRMEREAPGQLAGMPQAIEARPDLSDALELRSLLRRLTPRHANHPGAPLYYQGLALQVAGAFSAHCAEGAGRGGAASDTGKLAGRAKALMAESLARPLTVDELAGALFVSRTQLCSRFRRETGTSIGAFQAGLRMRRAEELLRSSDASIADIARQVGYAHQSTFATAFKRAHGTAPQRWRQERRP